MSRTSLTALSIAAVAPDTVAAPSFTYDNSIANTAIALATSTIAEANNFIDNDEDTELATAKLSEAQHTINDANLRIQNELNEYRQEIDDYTQKISKYQADLGSYNADVGKEVQEFSNNLTRYGAEYKWWQSQLGKLQHQYDFAFSQGAAPKAPAGGE